MMKIKNLRQFFIAVSAAVVLVAAFPHPDRAAVCAKAPKTGRLLIVVPEKFDRFVYVSSLHGARTHHEFGEQAVDGLRTKLSPFFSSIVVKHVEDAAAARKLLASRDYDRPGMHSYDLLAIPKFRDVNLWENGGNYGFDVHLGVAFYNYDGSKVTRVKGYGESTTALYDGFSPGETGSLALNKAVEAVADSVCGEANAALF